MKTPSTIRACLEGPGSAAGNNKQTHKGQNSKKVRLHRSRMFWFGHAVLPDRERPRQLRLAMGAGIHFRDNDTAASPTGKDSCWLHRGGEELDNEIGGGSDQAEAYEGFAPLIVLAVAHERSLPETDNLVQNYLLLPLDNNPLSGNDLQALGSPRNGGGRPESRLPNHLPERKDLRWEGSNGLDYLLRERRRGLDSQGLHTRAAAGFHRAARNPLGVRNGHGCRSERQGSRVHP